MAELNFNLTPVKSENYCHNRSLKRSDPHPRGQSPKTVIHFTDRWSLIAERCWMVIGENQSNHAPDAILPFLTIIDCNEPPKASTPASIGDERKTPASLAASQENAKQLKPRKSTESFEYPLEIPVTCGFRWVVEMRLRHEKGLYTGKNIEFQINLTRERLFGKSSGRH